MNPPVGFKHKVTDNLQRFLLFFFFSFHLSEELEFIYLINSAMNGVYRWVIEVNGAPGTLYANETYQLQVDFPEHYPMEAPQVKCITFSFCLCSISLFV